MEKSTLQAVAEGLGLAQPQSSAAPNGGCGRRWRARRRERQPAAEAPPEEDRTAVLIEARDPERVGDLLTASAEAVEDLGCGFVSARSRRAARRG